MERKPRNASDAINHASDTRYRTGTYGRNASRPRAVENQRQAGRPVGTSSARSATSYRKPAAAGSVGGYNRASTPAHSQSTRSYRPAPATRRPVQQHKRHISPVLFIIVAVLLIIGGNFGVKWLRVNHYADTFCNNISINGVDLGGYTHDEGLQMMRDMTQASINTTYTLTYQGIGWDFTAADFNASMDTDTLVERVWNIGHVGNLFTRNDDIIALNEAPISLTADLVYDETLMTAFVDKLFNDIYLSPVDAQVTITITKPYITTDSALGRVLDRVAALEQIKELVETGTGNTELPVHPLQPAVSSDEALGGLARIAEVNTDTSFRGANSRSNVKKALDKFNGLAVYPGDTVSFNEIVGKRTEALGWASAPEYAGNISVTGFGGGVCQASTTLYDAILMAGMDVIERSPHTMTVSYVDPSMDAAVSDDGKNMVFKNNTEHAIYIFTNVTKEYATVTIYGNRPQYRYELYSNIITKDRKSSRNTFIPDYDGKHVKYMSETKLYSTGKPACSSEGWLIIYDWDTGEEVDRRILSRDNYRAGFNIYWRGITPDPGTTPAT